MDQEQNFEGRLYSQDLPAIATGVGIDTLAITGAGVILESGQHFALKILELGGVGIIGLFGLAGIATGLDGIRHRRNHRIELSSNCT